MNSFKNWLLAAIALAVVVSYVASEFVCPALIVISGVYLGLFLVLLFKGKTEDIVFLLNIFILAFLLRIIASMFLYNFVFLSNGTGLLGDAWPYSDNGRSIVKLWNEGVKDFNEIEIRLRPINNAGNLGFYDVWNAAIFSFTGYSPLSVMFINCLACSLTILVIYSITEQIYNKKAAKLAAILTAFWPSLFLWSIQNLKEAISAFLISVLAWCCVKFRKQFKFYLVILAIAVILALKEFRGIVLLVFVAALLVSFFLPVWKNRKIEALALFVLFIAIVFLCVPFIKSRISDTVNLKIGDSMLDFMHERRNFKASGGTAFLSNFDFRNPLGLLLFIPIGLLVAWLAPFPWQIGSMLQIVSLPEMLVYYFFLFYFVAGARYVMNNKIKEAGIIISIIFIMQVVLAVSEGNIGTLFRHRAIILPLMFALSSIGFIEKKRRLDNAR